MSSSYDEDEFTDFSIPYKGKLMQLNIVVIQNVPKTGMTKTNKPYKFNEITFKNLATGKIEEKKINQFSDVFKTAVDMQAGMYFTIQSEKEGEFWQWKSITIAQEDVGSMPTNTPSKATPSGMVKNTYETPEERAKKQIYIVRQSSIANAIAMLSIGAKNALKKEDVLLLANELTKWVFTEHPLEEAFDDVNEPQVT